VALQSTEAKKNKIIVYNIEKNDADKKVYEFDDVLYETTPINYRNQFDIS